MGKSDSSVLATRMTFPTGTQVDVGGGRHHVIPGKHDVCVEDVKFGRISLMAKDCCTLVSTVNSTSRLASSSWCSFRRSSA